MYENPVQHAPHAHAWRSTARLAHVTSALTLSSICLPAIALAQDTPEPKRSAEGPMKTMHPDAFYGSTQSARAQVALPGTNLEVPLVDRRDEIDPLAIQGALFPSAHIPKTRRVVYRNQLIFGQQLSVRATDRFMLNATWVISPGSLSSDAGGDFDRRLALHARGVVYEKGDLTVAVQAGIQQQKGLYKRDTRILSSQLSTQLDYKISDSVVLGAGVIGNMPWRMVYTDFDLSSCEDRGDFIDESCIDYDEIAEGFPPGGRFAMGWVGLTYYSTQRVYLKTELFSGVRRGTILGIEGALYNDDSLASQLERYRTTDTSFGVVNGAPFGFTLSTGYTYERFALQGTLLMLPGALPEADNRDDGVLGTPPQIFPMMTFGAAF